MDSSDDILRSNLEEINRELNIKSSNGSSESFSYVKKEVLGTGSFGVVYRAECYETKEIVAIKTVLQDKRYKNRELQILKELNHPNVIRISKFFYTPAENDELYLNVVMEYVSDTLSSFIKNKQKKQSYLAISDIKIIAFQLLKGLNYIHSIGICHRDIKPHNVLIDSKNLSVKLCDFGSAKKLSQGDCNVSYICSRFYRAPELIFSATKYTTAVDIWSAGCVIAELLINEPIFLGETSTDQLVEIIKVLGTPTRKQIYAMNPEYTKFKFPIVKCYTFKEIFKNRNDVPEEFIDLISKLLVYDPKIRLTPLQALMHPFFDEFRIDKKYKFHFQKNIINKKEDILLPPKFFEFTPEEIQFDKMNLIKNIIPSWYNSPENNITE
jgi:serine/threonine protein kinase